MPKKRAPNDQLFATTWVHVFEEDTAEGEVYRPEEDDIPLSRRPRERLQLQADGSASVAMPGADDRSVAQVATWSEDEGGIVIRQNGGAARFQVVRQSPSRLVLRSGAPGDPR